MIKFTASLTGASHVGMDGWTAGESFSKDLVEGRWFSRSRWQRGRMNNRTEGGKFDSFVKRDTFLFQVCSGDLRHEFVVRKSRAPCELHGGGGWSGRGSRGQRESRGLCGGGRYNGRGRECGDGNLRSIRL